MKMKWFCLALLCSAPFLGFSMNVQPSEVAHDPLHPDKMMDSPMEHLMEWYKKAKEVQGPVRSSMADLATVTDEGMPTTRLMIVKEISTKGLVIYGDNRSRKFEMLQNKPYAAMTFNWMDMQRQVTLVGKVEKLSQQEAQSYFNTRSRSAQISSHASHQGKHLPDRSKLLNSHNEYRNSFDGKDVPMPEHWAGYRIVPFRISFWQVGPHNLHSVIEYDLDKSSGKWTKKLLNP